MRCSGALPACCVVSTATSRLVATVASRRTSSALATTAKGMSAKPTGQHKDARLHTPLMPSGTWTREATNHLTSVLDKLAVHEPYHGHDKVHIASGEGMHISHIGRHLFPQKHPSICTSKIFLVFPLSHLVCCLIIMCLLNFNHGLFLLRIGLRGAFFLEVATSMAQVFSGVCVSLSQWHSHLGHPATPTVRHVLHRQDLSYVSSNKNDAVRDTCQQGKSHQVPFLNLSCVVKTPLKLVFCDVWGPT